MSYVLGSRASIGGVLGQGRGGGGNGLLTGLVAYWKLDEASGNAIDAHSGGLTLTDVGGVGSDTGKVYLLARRFSGSHVLSRSSSSSLNIGNASFCVAAWVYQTAAQTAQAGVVSKWDGQLSFWCSVNTNSTINFQLSANGVSGSYNGASTGTVSINGWNLVVWQYNYTSNVASCWIDNGADQMGGTPSTAGVYSGTAAFRVGGYSAGYNRFVGRIGPVAFWKNRTLSAADRSALWNGGAGLAYSAFTG